MYKKTTPESKMTDGLLCPQCTNLSLVYHSEFYDKELDEAKKKKEERKRIKRSYFK